MPAAWKWTVLFLLFQIKTSIQDWQVKSNLFNVELRIISFYYSDLTLIL